MSISAQTFPTDLILPSLVSWFNSQETSSRSISDTDVALFRVRVILDANGQARMVVGDAPYTAEGSEYICEATFMWCGARGDNLTANTTSFSRFRSSYLNKLLQHRNQSRLQQLSHSVYKC